MKLVGKQIDTPPIPESFTIEDIQNSTTLETGVFHLYQALAERSGLMKALQNAVPRYWKEIFTLAAYLVTNGDPFSYCEDWLSGLEAFNTNSRMTSQRISEILLAITQKNRNAFYRIWCSLRSEKNI
jgi:hypothetical protein